MGLQAVFQQVEQAFGPVNGVIHAAGITKELFHPLPTLHPAVCADQFRPKVNGLLVLHELLQGKALDFCILLSSLASVLGGLGMAAYAAVNLFMDAFAHQQNRQSDVHWLSVNLDGWQTEDEAHTTDRQGTGNVPAAFGSAISSATSSRSARPSC